MGRVVGGKGERDEGGGGGEEGRERRGGGGRGGGQCALKTSMQLGEEERGGGVRWEDGERRGEGKECNNHMCIDAPSHIHPSQVCGAGVWSCCGAAR